MSVPHELALTVHGAVVGASRLWVTEWFALHWRHMEISPQPESEDYYALLRRYAHNLAEHRHNVALISPLALARYTVGSNGLLAIDFSRFDRWVQIFKEEGVVGRIEGGHIGGRKCGCHPGLKPPAVTGAGMSPLPVRRGARGGLGAAFSLLAGCLLAGLVVRAGVGLVRGR